MNLSESILQHLTSLKAGQSLIDSFQKLNDVSLTQFVKVIDDSDYMLSDWLKALVYFEKWQDQNQKELSLRHKIEYLACCVEGSKQAGKFLPLEDVCEFYLNQYGVNEELPLSKKR